MRNSQSTADTREEGWALVSVLWVVSILAMLSAATVALVSTSYRLERRALESSQMDALFQAGLSRAVAGILDTSPATRWRTDGTPYEFEFDGHKLQISIQDELGKIDLNAADESLLRRLFASEGLDELQTETMVDRILDWRGTSDLKRLHGANSEDYRNAGLGYGPRHGPFQTVEELKLVLGMTPELFARVQPALTVYTKRPTFDPEIAPATVLTTLPGYDTTKAQNAISERRGQNIPDAAFPAASAPLRASDGHAYTISVKILAERNSPERETVIELTGDPTRPYFTLALR